MVWWMIYVLGVAVMASITELWLYEKSRNRGLIVDCDILQHQLDEAYARVGRMVTKSKSEFVHHFNILAYDAAYTAKNKGWDDQPSSVGEMIALMHSELSEALENLRQGVPTLAGEKPGVIYLALGDDMSYPADDHIPKFAGVEAEFADVIIRIMHNAHKRGYRVAEALVAKMAYNESRPHKHGGKAF